MTAYVEGPVRVSVPATSANLGPGFDSLGLALDLRDELEAEIRPDGLVVEVAGAGAGVVPLDETHLVVRAMRAAFAVLGAQPPGLRLRCRNVVPHARGLGSSSAAIVGGAVLARALVVDGTRRLDDHLLFQLAAKLEGHPDNVAPALHGGFLISGRADEAGDVDQGGFYAVSSPVDPRVSVVLLVPPDPVSTEVARTLLPAGVPHALAAADAGRAALLVAALGGQTEHLWRATRDYLHQDHRRPAMPASVDLVHALRADGVAAVISGAGPTVLAFSDGCDSAGTRGLMARCPRGWVAHDVGVAAQGARVLA